MRPTQPSEEAYSKAMYKQPNIYLKSNIPPVEAAFIPPKNHRLNLHLSTNLKKYIHTILIACVFLTTQTPAKQTPLQQKLQQIQKLTGVGAVAYTLVENNTIISTGGIGSYALDNPRPVTATSLFRIGSITKTFTALAAMNLTEQGKLQLDQAVKTIIPGVPLNNPWSKTTPVTLAMVLEHTAGLQDLTAEEFSYPKPLSLRQAFKVKPEARRLHWPPGYHFSYSNAGAGYAGRVIETVTGENYDRWFKREILDALGMQDSQLHWSKDLEESLVTGYDSDLKTQIPYWHTLFRPFGGLNTSARDMARFLMLFTDASNSKQRIVSARAITRMETPKTSLAAKAGFEVGYGLGLRNRYFKGHRFYGHGGDGDGYLAEFAYSKESHRGYFVVINAFRHDLLEEFTALLNGWLIEGLDKADETIAKPVIKSLSGEKLQAILGDYREATTRFPLQSKAQLELLRVKQLGKELYRCFPRARACTEILPVTEILYRTREEPDASMAFVKAQDGHLYLQGGFGNYQKIKDLGAVHKQPVNPQSPTDPACIENKSYAPTSQF